MINNLIIAERQTGKTRHLITKCSQDNYSLIVCPTRAMCRYIVSEAENMKLYIPTPITFDDFVKGRFDSRHVEKFYFDELQLSLSTMTNGVPIDTVIVGFNENSNLYVAGNSINVKGE